MSKILPENKSLVMADVGLNYAVIKAAEDDVHKLKVSAAPTIKDVVDSFGPGPHKMPVPVQVIGEDGKPTGENKTEDYIVTFRRDGKTYTTHALKADSIT